MFRRNASPRRIRHVEELAISPIPVQLTRLLERLAKSAGVYELEDMAIGDEKVLPTVVVEIHERSPPLDVLSVAGQAGFDGNVQKAAVAIVAIQSGGVAGEVGLEDIEIAVAIEVGGGRSHSGLLAPVFI